jgi:hypothetical protein
MEKGNSGGDWEDGQSRNQVIRKLKRNPIITKGYSRRKLNKTMSVSKVPCISYKAGLALILVALSVRQRFSILHMTMTERSIQ